MQTLAAGLVAAEPGRAVIPALIAPRVLQQQGPAPEMLALALRDRTTGYAVLPVGAKAVTAETKINVLAQKWTNLLLSN